MSESIKQRIAALADVGDGAEIKKILDTLLADITSIRTQVVAINDDVGAIHTGFTTLTAQLDADTGVNDTDYAANCDPAAITAADPDALTTTS